jgi:hypothetical protein
LKLDLIRQFSLKRVLPEKSLKAGFSPWILEVFSLNSKDFSFLLTKVFQLNGGCFLKSTINSHKVYEESL